MSQEVTVLAVQKWTIDNDGDLNSGITVHFFDSFDAEDTADRRGIFPASITAKPEMFDSFTKLPGKYDFTVAVKRGTGGKGKPVLRAVQLIEK